MSLETTATRRTGGSETKNHGVCGLCDEPSPKEGVPVVAGGEAKLGSSGEVLVDPGQSSPEVQYWHLTCVRAAGFDIDRESPSPIEKARYYVNAATVAAFMLGLTLMFLVASVMAV